VPLRDLEQRHGVSRSTLARYKIKRDAAKTAAQAAAAALTVSVTPPAVLPRSGPAPASTPPQAQTAPPPRPTPSVQPVSQNPQADGEAVDPTEEKLRRVLLAEAMNMPQSQIAAEFRRSERTVRRYLVEAKRRKLAVVKGSTAADMLASALFHSGHVRGELLRTYYEARSSGDRPSVLRPRVSFCQHSRDEIALLERAGALEALAPPTADKVEEPREPSRAYTPASVSPPTRNLATQAREALARFRRFQQGRQ
jgi:predicted transcriptional regulator